MRLFEPMEKQDAAIENTLVDLALNLSKRIVASEIKTEPKRVLDMVRFVLAGIPKGTKNIRISMCADDADLIGKLLPAEQREWQLVRDDDLASGGCIVETHTTLIDYSVESRLNSYLKKTSRLPPENLDPLPDYQALSDSPPLEDIEEKAPTRAQAKGHVSDDAGDE